MKHHIIRCAKKRPHRSDDAIVREECGRLLGGIDIAVDAKVVFRCETCKTFWLVEKNAAVVTMVELPKDTKLVEQQNDLRYIYVR